MYVGTDVDRDILTYQSNTHHLTDTLYGMHVYGNCEAALTTPLFLSNNAQLSTDQRSFDDSMYRLHFTIVLSFTKMKDRDILFQALATLFQFFK